MTKQELDALLPTDKPAELNQEFYRDLVNHTTMFGDYTIVKKQNKGWVVDFRGHGHPVVYKTKKEAIDMAGRWVTQVVASGLNRA